jgi:putative Mg2+ transporter-C (MgtC) family protein
MGQILEVFSAESLTQALWVLAKLGVGAVLGAFIGWERERGGHPAGIRTHMLVVIGVILFGESSRAFAPDGDPSRIAAQIVTGIGFLGAGAILRVGPEVRGLTTAASIWASAGIGMAVSVGEGFMIVAILATLLTFVTLDVVNRLENKLLKTPGRHTIRLHLEDRASLYSVVEMLEKHERTVLRGVRIASLEPELRVEVDLEGPGEEVMKSLLRMEQVRGASL